MAVSGQMIAEGFMTTAGYQGFLPVFVCCLLLLTFSAGPMPALGQVQMSGTETTPVSPATLPWEQTFSCASAGKVMLRYPDGSVFTFDGPCEGRVIRGGLFIKSGPGLMRFRKQRSAFSVTTPTAILGIRGTVFFIDPSPASFTVILEEGSIDVTANARGSAPIRMQAGQTVKLQDGSLKVSPTIEADRKPWLSRFPAALLSSPAEKRLLFGELFLFGMTRVEQGSVKVSLPNQTPVSTTAPSNIPVGATVSTDAGQTARLHLECGSVIDLGPGASVAIRPFSLEVRRGDITVRHVGSPFPLKISGEVSGSLASESAMDLLRVDGRYAVRMQSGECRFGTARDVLKAGSCGEITDTGIRPVSKGIPLAEWKMQSGSAVAPLPEFAPDDEPVAGDGDANVGENGGIATRSVVQPSSKKTATDVLRRHTSPGNEGGGVSGR